MRLYDVNIGGTSWKPKFPNEDEVSKNIDELLKIKNATDRAITIMCYLMRTQFFSDGNEITTITPEQLEILNLYNSLNLKDRELIAALLKSMAFK